MIVTDPVHLQNIRRGLCAFREDAAVIGQRFSEFLRAREEEIEAGLERKMRQFERNEENRRMRLRYADDDNRPYVLCENETERMAELEELREIRAAIREYGACRDEFSAALREVCVNQADSAASSASAISVCIGLLESYLATNVDGVASTPSVDAAGQGASGSAGAGSASPEDAMRAAGKAWASGLSAGQRGAITDYTREVPKYYENINAVLRGKVSAYDPGNEERAEQIHTALSTASTPADMVVYRGVGEDFLQQYRGLPDSELAGHLVDDAGFASTSMSRSAAFGERPIMLEINLPRGSRGACIESISAHAYEQEVLLDRNQLFRINSARRENGKRIINASVIN